MKKGSTSVAKQSSEFSQPQLTMGLDLGDRSSWCCVLDERGEVKAVLIVLDASEMTAFSAFLPFSDALF
jgi:hypothetical protein